MSLDSAGERRLLNSVLQAAHAGNLDALNIIHAMNAGSGAAASSAPSAPVASLAPILGLSPVGASPSPAPALSAGLATAPSAVVTAAATPSVQPAAPVAPVPSSSAPVVSLPTGSSPVVSGGSPRVFHLNSRQHCGWDQFGRITRSMQRGALPNPSLPLRAEFTRYFD